MDSSVSIQYFVQTNNKRQFKKKIIVMKSRKYSYDYNQRFGKESNFVRN